MCVSWCVSAWERTGKGSKRIEKKVVGHVTGEKTRQREAETKVIVRVSIKVWKS